MMGFIHDALVEAKDFVDGFSDMDDGPDGVPVPNRAMVVVANIEHALTLMDSDSGDWIKYDGTNKPDDGDMVVAIMNNGVEYKDPRPANTYGWHDVCEGIDGPWAIAAFKVVK